MIWIACATLTWTLFLNLCDLIFQCGCRSLWDGAAMHCNIHQPHGRHCPLCLQPPWFFNGLVVLIAAVQGAILFTGPLSARRSLAALAAFPVLGSVVAGALGWVSGYWN